MNRISPTGIEEAEWELEATEKRVFKCVGVKKKIQRDSLVAVEKASVKKIEPNLNLVFQPSITLPPIVSQ